MEESSIRPQDLAEENLRLYREDLSSFMKHQSEFVAVNCPACGSEKHVREFDKEGFFFDRCGDCGTLFINPRPAPALLDDYYSTSKSIKHWNDKMFPASETTRRSAIFAPRAAHIAELCKKYVPDAEVLFDVGAGFGTFCEEVKKTGLFRRVVAVEPAPGLAQTCRNKGLEVIEKPIEQVEVGSAGVITNFELIEHLFDPGAFIRSCRNSLQMNGLLILTTPNCNGFDLSLLGKASDNIAGPNHLNYFTSESLSVLLTRCGFSVIEMVTPGKLDAELVRNKIIAGAVSVHPFIKYMLVDRWESCGVPLQDFLAANVLSSHLWIAARKI